MSLQHLTMDAVLDDLALSLMCSFVARLWYKSFHACTPLQAAVPGWFCNSNDKVFALHVHAVHANTPFKGSMRCLD